MQAIEGCLAPERSERIPDCDTLLEVLCGARSWPPEGQRRRATTTGSNSRLPAETDAFVGRVDELFTLDLTLQDARLVTVVGTGGAGKTRLVVHHARQHRDDWPGGVWFCDLSEARGLDGIAFAVANALDVPLGKDPIVQLGRAIAARRRCLVVLDNFEQVARDAANTLGRWLDRAKEAQFVVTTREVLGLPGEQAMALAPLRTSEGVRLFEARARQAKRDLVFSAADLRDVESLVEQLDGLPLAIELAAARVRVMPPKTILDRLKERFRLLASGGGRHTRQTTLRATLDWSWDLLSADEQAALAQVSVFEGGFTLEAAEAVLSLAELWPMDAVQALVDKSLVREHHDRFDLLVSVQIYAAEKLDAAGTTQEAEARHGAFYASLDVADAVEALIVQGGGRLRALVPEVDNLVAACRRAVARSDGRVATSTLCAAWEAIELRGPVARGEALARAVLALELSPGDRQRARRVWGRASVILGRVDLAREQFAAALEQARSTGDRRGEAIMLGAVATLEMHRGHTDDARARFQTALAIHRELGNRVFEGVVVGFLGALDNQLGRSAEARVALEAALAIHREVGNRRFEGDMRINLGILSQRQGRLEEAQEHYGAARDLFRDFGDRRAEGVALGNLANVLNQRGHVAEAQAHYEAALAVQREVGYRRSEGIVVGNLGSFHHDEGRLDEARGYYEAALAVHRELCNRGSEGIVLGNLARLDLAQGRLNEARRAIADGEALLRDFGERFALATLLADRVHVEVQHGDVDQARAVLSEVESLAADLGVGPESKLGAAVAAARAAAAGV